MTIDETEELLKTRRKTDDNYVIVEECLKEIKKDIRTLPCKNIGEGCLQEKPLKDLSDKIEKISNNQEVCNSEKLNPLMASNIILTEKQDQTQKILIEIRNTLNQTHSKLDVLQSEVTANNLETTKEIADLRLSLVTQLTGVVANRDAVHSTKIETRTVIAWTAGLIISVITIFTFLKNFVLQKAADMI